MSWAERATARGARAVEQRRARLIAAIAGGFAEIGGIRATAEPDAVVIEGRGLAKRRLDDSRLRFLGHGR